ncbi:helix-turn-helix transcriptional regulator [Ravibacter arvi]|uniref:Helix-turn-helix transcriptional regulator n=2 Tax=Ravibacter arvi TaxID=2051041 RepID=A0ABP8LLW5_9BACT
MLGLKQEGLAWELGEEWSQKRVSILEQKEVIEQDILEEVAKVLKVPAEAIKNFDADNAINIISETINNHDQSALIQHNPIFNFNPIDKWVEALDENKKLYERLLQAEREKVELLQRMVDRN